MGYLDRVYGIELECFPRPGTRSREAGMKEVGDALRAAGVEATVMHTHRGTAESGWTVKQDNSVTGNGLYGMEVVSPPTVARVGLVEGGDIDKVCAVLNRLECGVNITCGFHVHVDRCPPGALRRLAYTYATYEDAIDTLMPTTRRGERGGRGYAQSIKRGANLRAIAGARDANDICRVLAIPSSPKYAKVNFSRYWSGTVEFRHHSGTMSALKVKNWIKFVLRFMEYAEAHPIEFAAAPLPAGTYRGVGGYPDGSRRRRRRLGRRRRQYVSLVTRPEGATRDEIFAETGWARGSLSMIRFARESGIVLRRSRMGNGAYRFYGRFGTDVEVAAMPDREADLPTLTSEPEIAPTLERLFFLLDVADDERTYWNERVEHFASLARGPTAPASEATL